MPDGVTRVFTELIIAVCESRSHPRGPPGDRSLIFVLPPVPTLRPPYVRVIKTVLTELLVWGVQWNAAIPPLFL